MKRRIRLISYFFGYLSYLVLVIPTYAVFHLATQWDGPLLEVVLYLLLAYLTPILNILNLVLAFMGALTLYSYK